MATGRKRTLPFTKVTSHKKKKSPGQSSAAAALQTDDLINLPSSSSEGNFLKLSSYACVHLDTNHAIYLYYQDIPKDQSEGEEEDPPSTPPPSSSTIQVLSCLLSKHLNSPIILNLALFPFDFIRHSIHLRLPENPEQTLC